MKEGMTTDGVHTPPEFISTHPSNDRRIAKFDEWLPSAMETFNGDDFGDKCRRVREDMAEARRRVAIDASSRGN
jgi:predicted Zn-dependent protease